MGFLKIVFPKNLIEILKDIRIRFPVAIMIIFIVTVIFFILLHNTLDSVFSSDNLLALNFSLILTFVFSIGVSLATESFIKSKLKGYLFQIIPIIFGILFYSVFSIDVNNFENTIFFFLSFSGIFAFLFFAPYISNIFQKGVKQSIFYTYFYNLSTALLTSFIFALILFILGAVGILAVNLLFELNIAEYKTYWNWVILSLSLIAPVFALTQIPIKSSFLNNEFKENIFFSFLVKFIAIPFIALFFLILYVYSVKVLLNFNDWPKGEVSWLVILFSIFGYLIYSFSYIFEEKIKLIKRFRKVFPYVVIPQIFMLFYAIYLRIGQYDLTINRYFVVVFGLCLLVISLYFIFSRVKNFIIIPIILALFIITISIIPKYNIYDFPQERQLSKLVSNLEKANILQNGKIVPLNNINDISQDLSKDIYGGIKYLCDFNSCEDIKELFPVIYSDILKEYKLGGFYDGFANNKNKEPSTWLIVDEIAKNIKVSNYFSGIMNNFIQFSRDYKQDLFPLDIKGYSKIYTISSYITDKNSNAVYDGKNEEIIININSTKKIKIPTNDIREILLEKFGTSSSRELNKDDLTFELEDGKYKVIFDSVNVINPDYNGTKNDGKKEDNYLKMISPVGYVSGHLLVR